MEIGVARAERFLRGRFGDGVAGLAPLGVGAWSRCFGFRAGGADLVVRFGSHVEDFEKDRRAHAYDGPDLPVPEVVDIGEAFAGYYAVSTRAAGTVLEGCSSAEWSGGLADRVAAAMEAMRLARIPAGWGGWDGAGRAAHGSWREALLEVGDDPPTHRTHGWRAKLRASPGGDASFERWHALLDEVASNDVPRSLLHQDLINRNVHVADGRLTGVFDWGCGSYGDHLYELAWFEFWSPWHPNLDAGLLRERLEARWGGAGYGPAAVDERLLACHLHIGLDHLAYNAHLENGTTLAEVERRLEVVAGGR